MWWFEANRSVDSVQNIRHKYLYKQSTVSNPHTCSTTSVFSSTLHIMHIDMICVTCSVITPDKHTAECLVRCMEGQHFLSNNWNHKSVSLKYRRDGYQKYTKMIAVGCNKCLFSSLLPSHPS